jgi:glutamate/tyrosine decarboxylase-like PLP-dependent enzyme
MPASVYAILKKHGKAGMRSKVQNLMRLTNEVRARLSNLGFELFQSDLNIIGVKGNFPLSNEKYLVHECADLPHDLTKPLEKQRTQTVWNVVVMDHVQRSISELERDLQKG